MRKRAKRTFTLQLYDRIELSKKPPKKSRARKREHPSQLPDHVRDMLQGNALKCPSCNNEPHVTGVEVHNNAHMVHTHIGSSVGVATGPPVQTIEATCQHCRFRITYDVDPNGSPGVIEWQR